MTLTAILPRLALSGSVTLGMVGFSSLTAAADNCAEVLQAARLSQSLLDDETNVRVHAENFCRAFSQGNVDRRNSKFDASYKAISAAFRGSRLSVEETASRFCKASFDGEVKDRYYAEYTETIAPGAFSAYNACKQFSGSDIQFAVDKSMITPTDLTVVVKFNPSVAGASAEIEATTTTGINCSWNGVNSARITISDDGSATLRCTRSNNARGNITLVRNNGLDHMALPWAEYTEDGEPVDVMRNLTAQVADARSTIEKLLAGLDPSRASCEWSGWKSARGSPTIRFSCPGGYLRDLYIRKYQDTDDWNSVRSWQWQAECCKIQLP